MSLRPSDILSLHRNKILETAKRFPVANPRVFGSVAQGVDKLGSDLDLLIDPLPKATLFDLGGLQDELQTTLGIRVDVLTPQDLPKKFRAEVLAQAQAL